uniref:DNA-directed DNA polymerase n=1 Tax=Meloidogyne incognita TaxID=6306 RepID=A0A914LRF1_MELIC
MRNLPERLRIVGGRKNATTHHRINQQCLIKINNIDGKNHCLFFALQATLVSNIGGLSRSQFYDYLHSRYGSRNKFKKETYELIKEVGATFGLKEYAAEDWVGPVVDYWNNKYNGNFTFKVFIFGSSGNYKPKYKYGPEIYDTPIILYHDSNHFDGVQKVGNIFGQPYCLSCEVVYDKPQTHSAKCCSRCLKCSQTGPKFPCKKENFYRKCKDCCKTFENIDCFLHHLNSGFCKTSKQCEKCGEIYNYHDNNKNGRKGHVCFEKYCGKCGDYHDPKRGCYIRPLKPKQRDPYRLVAFDLETMQHKITNQSRQQRIHETNFIAAKIVCPKCITTGEWKSSLKNKSCKVCGPHRTITFSQQPYTETTTDHKIISQNPLESFALWVLYDLPNNYDTYIYSHFGGRFDMVLVFEKLYNQNLNPELIMKGNKLYEMKVTKRPNSNPNIVFRDSYNLMPMALAALVPTFGLEVEDKPFFPHLSNRPENYGKRIFPTKEDYLADGMMPAKRIEFDIWYEENKNTPFLLDEALASYCTNDVEILMCALIAFRNEFFETTKRQSHNGIDALRECMTIASACMKHFRTNHLQKEHLAIVPERGYENVDNQSLLALKFFQWYREENNVEIQTAHWKGEKVIGKYKLDGWIEEQQLGIEVNGCAWHGCKDCYPRDNMILPNGLTAGKKRQKDKERMEYILTQIPEVKVYWQCEIEKMLRRDREMKKKFDNYLDEGPLEIRDCFFGGRTGPLKLFHKAEEGEKISYYDVTSLYPFTNFITNYPIGHPNVHNLNEEVNWTTSTDNKYPLALLKVFVIPPKTIDIPILPVKLDEERLLFPLCAKCAEMYPNGGRKEFYNCQHSDRQRGWVSTCTSIELNAALDEGYIVTKIYRVLEYTKSDNELFRPYMREFLAHKIHASGFDEKIRGNREEEEKFVKDCLEMFGMKIEREKMIPNKGKRAIAKLAVNNLWGRFSLRNQGFTQTHITDDLAELGEYIHNNSIEVAAIEELNTETLMIRYSKKKEWIEEHDSSNVVISLWTTSAARLHLLKLMQKVVRTPGCSLLYTDTDSLIFAHPENNNPLELGPHLGDLTDEYPQHHILEYCSGGAKQYGLKLKRKNGNDDYEYVLKVRGMTLNYDVMNNQNLRYETFKDTVINFVKNGDRDPICVIYPNFLRPSVVNSSVTSQPFHKMYKPFVGKGIIRPSDFSVLNFGHVSQ